MSDEDYEYGDDDFEDLEVSSSVPAIHSKYHGGSNAQEISPTSKSNPHHVRLQQIQHQQSSPKKGEVMVSPRVTTATYSDDFNPDYEDENDEEDEQSKPDLLTQMGGVVDLESYLKNMLASPPAANEDDDDNEGEMVNAELQPLDGVQPEDEAQRRLQAKLGYSPEKKVPTNLKNNQQSSLSVSPSSNSMTGFPSAALLSHVSIGQNGPNILHHPSQPNSFNNNEHKSPSAMLTSNNGGSDHVAHLLAMAGDNQGVRSSVKNASDAENALKVDALLRDLFPDRYKDKETPVAASIPTKKQGKKKKKASSIQHQQYGLGAPRPARKFPIEEDDDDEGEDDGGNNLDDENNEDGHRKSSGAGTDLLGGLEQQLKMLKKELKTKDDKIQRLTEHSMMMANQLDKFRGEVARLNARLHESQMELEAKESRLVEVMRRKKKDKKKQGGQPEYPADLTSASNAVYEGEIIRLREREQALMDAVEELSSQNEDLIIKLRESMQRELELSSKRAQLVSHTVHREGVAGGGGGGGGILPSIHEKHSQHYGGQVNSGMLRAQTEPTLVTNITSNSSSNNHHNHEDFPTKPTGKKKKKHSSG